MTTRTREDLNNPELAWATADALLASAMDWLPGARESLPADRPGDHRADRDGRVLDPALLRAWGAL